jgi:glycosyltransferase involved in cell wall biosynthesis
MVAVRAHSMVSDDASRNLGSDAGRPKPRIVVVSHYLDKRHGTERRVAEWISGLADDFEIHVYSQRVEDIDLGKITWHRIPKLPGPHLLNYVWWLFANSARRAWDRRFRGIRAGLVFSPGVNCLDADVISVHIVFAEYARKVAGDLKLSTHPVYEWPQLVHRKLYYRLIAFLEGRVYRDSEKVLISIARRTDRELARRYGRQKPSSVIYLGLDQNVFSPQQRFFLRERARNTLGYLPGRFVLLLIGNHWANKGLPVLLEALASLRDLPVDLLVVGRENPDEYHSAIESKQLRGRVQFKPPRTDVEFYYSAADAYVGPSLEDTFALPPAEAMACGLPVIVSAANGTSEIITHEVDGLILEEPNDAHGLAAMIRRLHEDEGLRARLSENAHQTAQQYTWERNVRELRAILEDTLRKKSQGAMSERNQKTVFHEVIRSTREMSHRQYKKVRATLSHYLADYPVERNGEKTWVEHPAKRAIHAIYDVVSEPLRSGHLVVPRMGNDRTAYVIGLYGVGRFYIHELMLQNFGERAKYIREWIRFHPRPTSMIYTGHATMKYASRGQRLPAVTSRILEAVRSRFADLIFVYRHPFDSLLTNWLWWRTYIREKRIINTVWDVYKTLDDLCVGLEQDFQGFKAFAEGDPRFFAGLPGPPFLSLSEFVEETDLYIRSATLALRLEDFGVDPRKEFLRIAEVLSVPIDLSALRVAPPRARPYNYLAVQERVARFRDFINGLDLQTKRRIETIGYSLEPIQSARGQRAARS